MIDNLHSADIGLRLATIDLIKKCAQDGFSYQTELPDVNGETTFGVISILAFGVDRDGCWAEEDARVRQAAAEAVALMESIDKDQEISKTSAIAEDVVELEAPTGEPVEIAQPDENELITPPMLESVLNEPVQEISSASEPLSALEVVQPPQEALPGQEAQEFREDQEELADQDNQEDQEVLFAQQSQETDEAVEAQSTQDEISGSVASVRIQVVQPVAPAPAPQPILVAQPLQGIVDTVDIDGERAIIRFGNPVTPPRQARVLVTHRYILGRLQTIGEFEITDIAPGMATIRPIAGTSIKRISTGDSATVLGK